MCYLITKFLTQFTVLTIVIATIASCSINSSKDNKPNKSLSYKESRLGTSDFYISIPTNYKIKENIGPDFVVYNFSPTDTMQDNIGTGGIYFGGFPNIFGVDNANLKYDSISSFLLSKKSTWTIYKTEGSFIAEAIIDNGENKKTHAFVSAKSKSDIDSLVKIFTTLTLK